MIYGKSLIDIKKKNSDETNVIISIRTVLCDNMQTEMHHADLFDRKVWLLKVLKEQFTTKPPPLLPVWV